MFQTLHTRQTCRQKSSLQWRLHSVNALQQPHKEPADHGTRAMEPAPFRFMGRRLHSALVKAMPDCTAEITGLYGCGVHWGPGFVFAVGNPDPGGKKNRIAGADGRQPIGAGTLNSARDFLTITTQTSNSQGAALEIQPFCHICQQQSKCGSLNTSDLGFSWKSGA